MTLAYKTEGMFEKVSGWEILKLLISAMVPIMLFVFGGIWTRWQAAKKVEEEEKRAAQKEQTEMTRQIVIEVRDLKETTKLMNTHFLEKFTETSQQIAKLESTTNEKYKELKEDIRIVHARIDEIKK